MGKTASNSGATYSDVREHSHPPSSPPHTDECVTSQYRHHLPFCSAYIRSLSKAPLPDSDKLTLSLPRFRTEEPNAPPASNISSTRLHSLRSSHSTIAIRTRSTLPSYPSASSSPVPPPSTSMSICLVRDRAVPQPRCSTCFRQSSPTSRLP